MEIQLETPDMNAIRSYSNEQITVGTTTYQDSVIVSSQQIISAWPVHSVQELNEDNLESMLALKPDVIIIGHVQMGIHVPLHVMQYLSRKKIGMECMSIGAACRTFNVLLSERREVVVGIIL